MKATLNSEMNFVNFFSISQLYQLFSYSKLPHWLLTSFIWWLSTGLSLGLPAWFTARHKVADSLPPRHNRAILCQKCL